MHIRPIRSSTLLAVFVVLPGVAQELKHVGVQVRLNAPADNVAEATGRMVGVGGSLHYEMDLEDGYRWRIGGGGDKWGYGKWENRPGWRGMVWALHVEVEGLKFLKPDVGPHLLGPYVAFGVRGVAWMISAQNQDLDLRTGRRTNHIAASVALGYRWASWLDMEAKAWYGHADTEFRGGAYSVGVTYRF